jgi:DNA-binding NarL/FixJ family response regulator
VLPTYVADSNATMRRTLVATLRELDIPAEGRPDGLEPWLADLAPDRRALILTLRRTDHWELLRRLRRAWDDRRLLIIAQLTETDAPGLLRAYRWGACAVLDEAAEPEMIVTALGATRAEHTLVRKSAIQALVAMVEAHQPPAELDLTNEERDWLPLLADGIDISVLADRTRYSRSQLNVKLTKGLYRKLHAPNRSRAMTNAGRWGLV